MFTIIITCSITNVVSMFQYGTLEGARKMASIGYKETVHIFDENNRHIETIVGGQ